MQELKADGILKESLKIQIKTSVRTVIWNPFCVKYNNASCKGWAKDEQNVIL